jgi:hypothetical protein
MAVNSKNTYISRRDMLTRSALAVAGLAVSSCGREQSQPETVELSPFKYRVSVGWLRDLASEPVPGAMWPCIRWDDRLLEDQIRYLDVEAELGMNCNCAWGFFRHRDWPVPFENVIDSRRAEYLRTFVTEAHRRGIKVLAGVGIYSWGFEEVIKKVPGVSDGNSMAMCPHREEAWEWMKRVLDFHMDPAWGLDGISMQSADQGRCQCPDCTRLSPGEHHALLLTRCGDYIRQNRPEWVIGQASWGLRVDQPEELVHIRKISGSVDYMVEVAELSAKSGRRPEIISGLNCAFGSLGGVFVEPPQHWDRLRWFLPCGLGSARTLASLRQDGGLACEYFYRPFANPVEEVSWRTGARILSSPSTPPETALVEAVNSVYSVTGQALLNLADWFSRGERAYFSRVEFKPGDGSISLEPLIWNENPAAPGPPVYIQRRMETKLRREYAGELARLKMELTEIDIPNREAAEKTARCLEGTLADLSILS